MLELTMYELFNFHVARLTLKSNKSACPAQLDQVKRVFRWVSSLAFLEFSSRFPFYSSQQPRKTDMECYRSNFSIPSMKLPQQSPCVHAK